LVLGQVVASCLGYRKALARTAGFDFFDQPDLEQQRERGIDHSRARGIKPARPRLNLADQLIAVPALFSDQFQNDELQLTGIEYPAPPAATMKWTTAFTRKMPSVILFTHVKSPYDTIKIYL